MPQKKLRRRGVLAAAALLAVGALAVPVVMAGNSPPARATGHGGDGGAKVVAEERVGERLIDLTVASPALGGETEEVRLLTPEGWEERQPGDDWSVLYLLDGGAGDHGGWTEYSDLAAMPELRDTLVVMPGMPFFGFYTDWWNGGKGGAPAVESFHLDELRPLLERDYGAGERRSIAGFSQGGYGAVTYAAHRPDLFQAAASYSGWLHPLQHPETIPAAAAFASEYAEVEPPVDGTRIWGDPVAQRDVWEANDPYHLADRLTGTPVYLSSGDGTLGELDPPDYQEGPMFPELEALTDQFPADTVDLTESLMHASTKAVAERYEAAGVPVTSHLTPGTHSPQYWDRELRRSLPMLLEGL